MQANPAIPSAISDEETFHFLDRALSTMVNRTDVALGPGERGRLFGWYWGYYGRAAIDMYRATDDSRFARLIERTAEALMEVRDDQLGMIDDERGVPFPGWGTKYKTGERSNEITTAGLITQPMLEYARLSGRSWISDAAVETLTAFKSERRDAGDGKFVFVHLTQNVVEALNHSSLYGAALAHASQTMDDPWLMETANGLYKYHHSFVDMRGDGLSWPYAPSPGQDKTVLPSEAIWKAAASIELPLALSEMGDPHATGFLQDVARSIVHHPVIIRKDYPQFIGHDSLNVVDGERISGGLSSFIGAFLQIDSAELRRVIFNLMNSRPELFPKAWRGGSRAMIMAWAHLRANGIV